MLWVHKHKKYFNSSSADTVFMHQNLTLDSALEVFSMIIVVFNIIRLIQFLGIKMNKMWV